MSKGVDVCAARTIKKLSHYGQALLIEVSTP